jgi:hypothetical protein
MKLARPKSEILLASISLLIPWLKDRQLNNSKNVYFANLLLYKKPSVISIRKTTDFGDFYFSVRVGDFSYAIDDSNNSRPAFALRFLGNMAVKVLSCVFPSSEELLHFLPVSSHQQGNLPGNRPKGYMGLSLTLRLRRGVASIESK